MEDIEMSRTPVKVEWDYRIVVSCVYINAAILKVAQSIQIGRALVDHSFSLYLYVVVMAYTIEQILSQIVLN